MTLIHGQIESLKRIRKTLDEKGITRFNSIGDINQFLKNFDNEKEELFFKIERDFDLELEDLQTKGAYLQKEHVELKNKIETNLNKKISQLKTKCLTLSYPAKNAVLDILNWYQLQILFAYRFILKKTFNRIVHLQTRDSKTRLSTVLEQVNANTRNRQEIISARCAPKFQELEHIKKVAEDLYPIIAGAIGEHLVAKELKKLSDDFVLFNDFSLKLEKPIYNKRQNDLIRSVQIDHLLVSHTGVFIIETKNWSKASLERYDLRSPVKQVQRVNFALYTLLNSRNTANSVLKPHHWGQRELPVYNIVAMIRYRPKERFKYVAIKTLKELNGYINRFEPVFDNSEVHRIADYLIEIKNQ
ncbi:nuclease-related domain-containing protein [Flagellimonas lutimaris]|uniref:nuclease-related domain-containing protein n=1 Tax=Flagellimonas lutimaris TaxID=475082 RepID=UPI003F5CF5B9